MFARSYVLNKKRLVIHSTLAADLDVVVEGDLEKLLSPLGGRQAVVTVDSEESKANETTDATQTLMVTLGDAMAEFALRSLHGLMSRLVYSLDDGLPISGMLQVRSCFERNVNVLLIRVNLSARWIAWAA